MTDLKVLLDLAAGEARPPGDVAADLERARAASRTRTLRRLRLGTASLAVALLAGTGIAQVVADDPPPASAGPSVPTVSAGDRIHLVATRLDAGPYSFDLVPRGWSVQSENPYRVTIAPDDGSASAVPDDFEGKLVILFDTNPPTGSHVVTRGREFWVSGDSGRTVIATRTRPGEPRGVTRVQYPDAAGWTRESMLRFLSGVHVNASARAGHG